MNQGREESESLPIACALTPAEAAAMRDGLLPGLLARATATDPSPEAFAGGLNPRLTW